MFLLNHVVPENAQGKAAEAYSIFPPGFTPPAPLVMMSASPDLCALQSNFIRYYMTHQRIDHGFFAILRFVLAHEYDYPFCRDFNAGLLKNAAGMTEAELASFATNPENAPLEEEQKALLLFVLKALRDPESTTKQDIDALHGHGFTDQDIFDAVYHGTTFIASSTLWKAFSKE